MANVVELLLLIVTVILFQCSALSTFKPSVRVLHHNSQQKGPRIRSFLLATVHTNNSDDNHNDNSQKTAAAATTESCSRRRLIQGMMSAMLVMTTTTSPSVCHAGEWGERLNRAVTQSELGIQVRREVVRGAQVLDQLDGQWEQFSDRLQLGTERSKQDKRPTPKQIPPLRPLDVNLAKQSLQICDQVFLDATKVSSKELEQSIQRISSLVQPSFERAGLKPPPSSSKLNDDDVTSTTMDDMVNGDQFNFWSYVHFRAYADLLLTTPRLQRQLDKNNYAAFKSRFEADLGQRLLGLVAPDLATRPPPPPTRNDASAITTTTAASTSSSYRWSSFQSSLSRVDALLSKLVQAGWIASTDISQVDEDQLEDWLDGLSDLSLSIALDGDATLGAQTLLQDQGFRLFPNYAKWAVATLLSQSGETVQVDEYYFDTDYSSDPNQYQVKEVLLNVVVQSYE